MDKG
jgi:hypothetical protein